MFYITLKCYYSISFFHLLQTLQPHNPEIGLGLSSVCTQTLEIFERWGHLFQLHLHQGCLHEAIGLLCLLSGWAHNIQCSVTALLLFKVIAQGTIQKWAQFRKIAGLTDTAAAPEESRAVAARTEKYSAITKIFREAERLQDNLQDGLAFPCLERMAFTPWG